MITSAADYEPLLRERVQRGASLLDELVPDWAQKIDLAELDLLFSAKDPIGQLQSQELLVTKKPYRSFDEMALIELVQRAKLIRLPLTRDSFQTLLGLHIPSEWYNWDEDDWRSRSDVLYFSLTTLWREEIEKRLGSLSS